MTGRYFFSVILLICVATAAAQENCTYTFVTKTGIQAAGATSGAQLDLIFYDMTNLVVISNISRYSVLGTHRESFQNDSLDIFFFNGPCEHYCDVALVFRGSIANSWNVELVTLGASLPSTGCDFFNRQSLINETFQGPLDAYVLNFCSPEAVGTEKQKLTGASLLRLFGMPSYTT